MVGGPSIGCAPYVARRGAFASCDGGKKQSSNSWSPWPSSRGCACYGISCVGSFLSLSLAKVAASLVAWPVLERWDFSCSNTIPMYRWFGALCPVRLTGAKLRASLPSRSPQAIPKVIACAVDVTRGRVLELATVLRLSCSGA